MNITLAIRASDNPAQVKALLTLLREEGLLTDTVQAVTVPSPNVPRPLTVPPSVAAKWGPNEIAWREANPGRVPVYSASAARLYPNKEAMFKAYLSGATVPATNVSQDGEGEQETEVLGAVLTGPLVIAEQSEDDYN